MFQRQTRHGLARRDAHLAGVGAAARGTGGTDRAGEVLPPLHGDGLQERDALHLRAGAAADQPRERGAAAQGHGDQRPHRVRFYGSAAGGDAGGGHGEPARAGGARGRGAADAPRPEDGGISPRAEPLQDAPALRGHWLFRRNSDHHRPAVGGKSILPAQGEAGAGGHAEGEISSGGGGPHHVADGVQGMGGGQVQQPVVLREFYSGAEHETRPGRPAAARDHHGPVQTRHPQRRQELQQDLQGRHGRLLHQRRQEGPPGGLPDPRGPEPRLHPPLVGHVQQGTRVGHLPRAGADHQGIHAERHGDRSQMAHRAGAQFLPGGGPHEDDQGEADAEDRAAVRPVQPSEFVEALQEEGLGTRPRVHVAVF
mmetsp:Transcript_33482/g.66145  ORF Transcript_33482/g.66145 Transcript_33482/m.66145 type:complete len:368 (+) Transcript_33482:1370-2473(+)